MLQTYCIFLRNRKKWTNGNIQNLIVILVTAIFLIGYHLNELFKSIYASCLILSSVSLMIWIYWSSWLPYNWNKKLLNIFLQSILLRGCSFDERFKNSCCYENMSNLFISPLLLNRFLKSSFLKFSSSKIVVLIWFISFLSNINSLSASVALI